MDFKIFTERSFLVFLLIFLNINAHAREKAPSLVTPYSYTSEEVTRVDAKVLVTGDDPLNPENAVNPGEGFDGVVRIVHEDTSYGSGALLWSGNYVLSAAHLFDDLYFNADNEFATGEYFVSFRLPRGEVKVNIQSIYIHPDYDPNDPDANNDIALVKIESVPIEADRYNIYRNNDEIGKTFLRVGFGLPGTGYTGQTRSFSEIYLLKGYNKYEATGDLLNELNVSPRFNIENETQLLFDFDSGEEENDFLGYTFGLWDLGLGSIEANSSSGDSGGPVFFQVNGDNVLAGITSYGLNHKFIGLDSIMNTDVDAFLNSSFGELSGDTRVSFYADFIDMIIYSYGDEYLDTDNEVRFFKANPNVIFESNNQNQQNGGENYNGSSGGGCFLTSLTGGGSANAKGGYVIMALASLQKFFTFKN